MVNKAGSMEGLVIFKSVASVLKIAKSKLNIYIFSDFGVWPHGPDTLVLFANRLISGHRYILRWAIQNAIGKAINWYQNRFCGKLNQLFYFEEIFKNRELK